MVAAAEAPLESSQPADTLRDQISQDEAAAMLRAALQLFERWQLSDSQARTLLGQPSARTYSRWKAQQTAALPYDTARRLSYLMGIHRSLRHWFKEPERAYAWVHKGHPHFGGKSALSRMLAGDVTDLAAVRTYLDSGRSGW